VLAAVEVNPSNDCPKCDMSHPVGPAYQLVELPTDDAAASEPNTRTQRSVSPNTTAYGRYRLKMSCPSSNRSCSASAVRMYSRNPRAWASTAVPAAVRAGNRRPSANSATPTSVTATPTGAQCRCRLSSQVSQPPARARTKPAPCQTPRTLSGRPRNQPARVTST
jgi:hypothetical protein